MAAPFVGKIAPGSKPWQNPPIVVRKPTFDKLQLPSLALGMGILQLALSHFLPPTWAAVPLASCLAITLLSHLFKLLTPEPPNPYLEHVVPGRTTAQFPLADGSYDNQPASSQVVVMNLGLQFNHPLGAACPGAAEMMALMPAVFGELHARREEYGLLGSTDFTQSAKGSNTFNTMLYFRGVEGVHRFAHCDAHRKVWDWYASKRLKHIGVYHEVFVVPRSEYESLYVNCRPALMGAASIKCDEMEGEKTYVNTLVSADVPTLKTQYARLGRDEKGNMKW